MNIEET